MNSIRNRLLLFLLPVTVLALAVAALGIERAVRRDLSAALDREILLLAQGIGSAVELEIDGTVEFELEEGDLPELQESMEEAFYAIADSGGSVLFSSEEPPVNLFSGPADEPVFTDIDLQGRTLRVCVVPIFREFEADEDEHEKWREENPGVPFPDVEAQELRVAAGMTDEEMRQSLATLRRRLLSAFLPLALLLAVFPAWAVSRALKPLRKLSRQADGIGPETPGKSLDEGGVDREVRPLVDALNRALDRLGKAYQLQKRFTADAAHELRSPLSAIRAQCEVSLRKDKGREELAEALRSVHRTTVRLGALVENLLSFTRLEKTGEKISKRPVDLAGAAREAVELQRAAAGAAGLELAVDIPDEMGVSGDDTLLVECLSSLIDNAIRYTPSGGRVRVEGGADPRPWVAVEDNGPGIPPEHIEKIFERFYRVDPSRSRTDNGSGLGLAIAREIARVHGADLTVESRPREGSRFTLAF